MRQRQILISGDYWHAEFKAILSSFDALVTMIPTDKLDRLVSPDDQFELIVLAESRRDQIPRETVDLLRERFAGVPLVNLLGSWCEGETRSGDPVPGLIRVYWHQWRGQYDKFVKQLDSNQISDWHLPSTASVADRIEASSTTSNMEPEIIGVSAWSQPQFEMLADSLKTLGYRSRWLERCTWDAEAIKLLSAICIDANSVTDDLVNRIEWLKSTFPDPVLILILNFPRINEAHSAVELGVSEVLSKPFELADLLTAVIRACKNAAKENNSVIQ